MSQRETECAARQMTGTALGQQRAGRSAEKWEGEDPGVWKKMEEIVQGKEIEVNYNALNLPKYPKLHLSAPYCTKILYFTTSGLQCNAKYSISGKPSEIYHFTDDIQ